MTQEQRPTLFAPPAHIRDRAHVRSLEEYQRLYDESVRDPEGFWAEVAARLDWFKSWDRTLCFAPDLV